MKLINISLHGFKSFADKTKIDINDGITGIVGPNGSGKSNIVDAIKWVLGEQSLKDIRGGNTSSDVIFNGSKSRSPLTRCWVSLTFDNSDHYLKSDLDQIEIKRVVYSSGENEYYINNEQVRLKDITNLFIDSGSSAYSLSIISQGKIADIVNGKPEEKRKIVEEAAGVLQYKKRKEESLRKLDKTNDNLSKIDLIIDELKVNIDPLREQSEVATKYLNYKSELEKTEIALLAVDIKEINESYKNNKEEQEKLKEEILNMESASTIDNTKIEAIKHKLFKVEEEISTKNDELYTITRELALVNSEKQIMIERKKYEVEDSKLQDNIVNLKENELKIKNSISALKEDIKIKEDSKIKEQQLYSDEVNNLKNYNIKRDLLINTLYSLNKEEQVLKNQIDVLKDNIENDGRVPYAVRCILNNNRLKGIHNILGKLIETEEKYSSAIDVAMASNSNVVVVDNENNAKEAISYLKQNAIGRVTFYPLNVIKAKVADPYVISKISDDSSFIGLAKDLVKYNPIYQKIVLNNLGTTIIVDNLVNANRIGKIINHVYKIVTLDGEVIAPGGSITGGNNKNSSGYLNQKFDLENKIKLLKEKEKEIKIKEEDINSLDYDIKILENKIFSLSNNVNNIKDMIIRKNNELNNYNDELNRVINEINGTNGILNNNIDKELENILNIYYEKESIKEKLELRLSELKIEKNDYQSEINELELTSKKVNSEYNKKLNNLKEKEVLISREEYKLDSYLLRLNEEYGLTYEKALEYKLYDEINVARSKVNALKRDIKSLGEVNTGAISEYNRINTRYEFLQKQKEDLNNSINDLLSIIDDLDETMKNKLVKTFEDLNQEFNKVFKRLFKGGEASLVLLDPNDILNSGIEIKAAPPGKDIKSPKTLSGGEATLTAISLLFSVLNIRTVPFAILDEVEAALDEVNVDMFGNYLNEINSKTQFIIITHKKRTMEYTNNLYGVTMQESGVSKLVSVKLT